MADSSITKMALAAAMKELMIEIPFDKISISMICEKCFMNRKSFYYHYKDKYDLVNSIFDSEMSELIKKHSYDKTPELFNILCEYLYDNRAFYKKALKITGQNSLADHFYEKLNQIISDWLPIVFDDQCVDTFDVDFLTDGILCAIMRWMLAENVLPPKEFVSRLYTCFLKISKSIINNPHNSLNNA